MKRPTITVAGPALRLLAALLASTMAIPAWANPQGMAVARGSATATQSGSRLNVRASNGALLNWQSFNIQPGETTTFVQPSATSVVWNRILDPNLSQVWGTLNANGWVVLMNQNGFYFGPNSVINVHGLMVTTSPVAPESSGGGGFWQFNGTPPLASIINYGEIKAQAGGSVFLVSEKIENHGSISAPAGTIGLYAGKEVLISERPDGRGISATVKLPAGSVDNSGNLIADAGTIALHAQVVNQNGLVQANSVREHNGVIELVATDNLHLGPESVLEAKGDAAGVSQGGKITINSGQTFTDAAGSRIAVSGGAEGGNGGSVEISAPRMSSIQSRIDGTARTGWKGGSLFFDPTDIILSNDGTDSAGSGTVLSGDSPDTLRLNVNSAFAGFAQIRLEATRDISLDPFTSWNLNVATGIGDPGSLLTLEAGRNIVFGDNSRIVGGPGWSVRFAAGVDFASPQHSVRRGVGGIYFNGGAPDPNNPNSPPPSGSGSLETADGSISLEAGHEILVGGGFIRTVGGGHLNGFPGGNIDIKTGDGDVDAGTKGDWYTFFTTRSGSGYDVASQLGPGGNEVALGGIGTAYGGNVTIDAGRDILSFIPTVGAYGLGDVSLTAAGRIMGKFLVRNGHGVIDAGTDLGSGSSPVSLSLIRGGWDVHAHDIYLNEVLNPNGALNSSRVGTFPNRIPFKFDYAPDAFVNLVGDNSVQLLGSSPAHASTGDNADRLPIYPPQLTIQAGAGGVVLGNDVVLYPSSLGRLHITTTDGGSLRSTPGGFFQIVMSDSGSTDYESFASGHAATPLHLNDNDPVSLIISGDVQNLFLRSPKRTEVTVGGSTLNFSFEGQNLSANDVSKITIAGDFFSRSDRTSVTLENKPAQSVFDHIFVDPFYLANADLGARLSYNAATGVLRLQGRMTAADRDFLLHPYVLALDQFGNPRVDANGNPIYTPSVFTADAAAINALYASSQDIPSSGLAYSGLQIGGPGALAISARNMDLGISRGIRSVGPLLNNSLWPYVSINGADLTLNLTGDSKDPNKTPSLTMTSSQIASFNGGKIDVTAAGKLNVGSEEQFTSDDTPKGIYTAHGGAVTVKADGDIDVNGSRIATYDGGDVTVRSENGTVNTGGGAKGFFTVATEQLQVDPKTGTPVLDPNTGIQVLGVSNDRFFGSGIVTLTRQHSDAKVGNINVYAGVDIIAESAGIMQLAFNPTDKDHTAHLDLTAGRDIRTPSGVLGDIIHETAGRNIIGLIVGQSAQPPVLQGGPNGIPPPPGAVSGPQVTPPPLPPPPPPPQQTQTDDTKPEGAQKPKEKDPDAEKRREETAPVLSKNVGRVTVLLSPDGQTNSVTVRPNK